MSFVSNHPYLLHLRGSKQLMIIIRKVNGFCSSYLAKKSKYLNDNL